MTLKKTFKGDLKKMELTWETAESEAKDRNSWRKKNGCIILNGQTQQKKKMNLNFYNIQYIRNV